jgi:uncharacterized protein YcfJ
MITDLSRWLVVLASAAVGAVVGGFVQHEFGQGRTVPTAAGAVFGLGLAGARGRSSDALFPPGDKDR